VGGTPIRTREYQGVKKQLHLAPLEKHQRPPPPEHKEPGNIIRLTALVTLGALLSALAIGAWQGTPDGIVTALAIAGSISLLFWAAALFVSAPVLVGRQAGRLLSYAFRRGKPVRGDGGVSDGWLDGPS
jgi:hypothetical protein